MTKTHHTASEGRAGIGLRSLMAHPRLLISIAIGVVAYAVTPQIYGQATKFLAGWNAVAIAYLILVAVMIASGTSATMRQRAAAEDQGRWAILAVLAAGSFFSLVGLLFIQTPAKSAPGGEELFDLIFVGGTIVLSWLMLHTIFALHYAHDYYGPATDADGLMRGLDFPSDDAPDYWDFLYFSFVVGMTCQVSDVQVTRRGLRRLTLVHGIVSFFFNTFILALTINIIAGML